MSCDHLSDDIPECPLCLEPFALDDINFYPCACRYQICRFCWHRIRTDENGLCPHCREPYSENPAEYTPPSQDQLVKLKHDKKQKTHDKKQKLIESRKSLSSLRVVQKNLVFVIGLSPRLAEPDILRKNEYFGKYGKIYKVVINNSTVYNGAQGPSVSAYVTYYREEDASKAIQAVNNAFIDGRHLKASYGTTKYCTYFLRGSQCTKPDCMYLHEMGNEEASFTKEDMQAGKHQVFELQTLAASNPCGGVPIPTREQGAQNPSKKQDPLLKNPKEIDLESALPATASWGTRQGGGGGLLPLPQTKESKSHSSKHSKSQKHSKSSDGSGGGKTSGHGSRSGGPLSPHSILGAGPGSETSTTRRHNSTGSRMEHSGSGVRSTSITRSNSTAASVSSKSVSPNLSPKSSLSTSSSSGSLKQETESREGVGRGALTSEQQEVVPRDVEVTSGKPHPLESAVSRQLDCIDLDGEDDWGLQEIRANDDVISEGSDTVSMATDTANVIKRRPTATVSSVNEARRDERVGGQSQSQSSYREAGKHNAVDVLSSLGAAGSGQFGSLGVSWNSGAPLVATPSLPPSQYSAPGEQKMAQNSHHQMERNQTPDDDLGFDPWDVSTRGLAALLETEQKPPQSSSTSTPADAERRVVGGRGGGGGGGGMMDGSPGTLDSTANLSWQDELKTVFPNVNISFGASAPAQQRLVVPPPTTNSTSMSSAPSPFPSSSSSSTSTSAQTPLQQAINGAAHSLPFPYHHVGVGGGIGPLFGYTTPTQVRATSDYRSLYEAASSSQALLARAAFEAQKHPTTTTTSTTNTNSTTDPKTTAQSTAASSNSKDTVSGATSNGLSGGKGFAGSSNSIEWPDLAASNVSAVGSKRTTAAVKNSSGTAVTSNSSGLPSSNAATWNGSMGNGTGRAGNGNGNGTTKDSTVGTANNPPKSKDLPSSGGAIAPPPGFANKSSANKDNMSLNSSINHALWNNTLAGKGVTGQAGVTTTAQQANPAMTNQILQNWAKYLQMNFGGLTRQQLASNPLYQQMVRQQQQYWAMLRQQQLLQLQKAGMTAAGVSVATAAAGCTVLTPAQIQQLQARMALSQSILNQATAHARLQQHQQQHIQHTLQQQAHQQQQPARNSSLGNIGMAASSATVATVPVSGQSVPSLGQAVRLGQSQGAPGGGGVLLKSANGQSGSSTTNRPSSQSSQKIPSK